MKIVKIGDVHRVLYVAKNFTTGLTNVTGTIIDPAGATTAIPWNGTTSTTGFCELAEGIYYFDFATTAKAAGIWTFKANSATKNNPAADTVQLVDVDTLDDTPYEKLDTMLDAVKAAIENGTYGLSAINDKIDIIDTNVDDIETLATGANGFSATKTVVDAIQTSIGNISNSTKNTWVTAEEVVIPDTGSITRRVYMTVFDGSGNLEDPDSNEIGVRIFNMTGTNVTDSYLTQGGSAGDPVLMTRDSAGRYHIDFTVESTDTAIPLLFEHAYEEGTNPVVREGVVKLVTSLGEDLSSRFDDVDSALTTIDTVVDGIQTDLSNGTDGLGALKTIIDAIQTDLSNGTDGLGALKTIIDGNNTLLSSATYGLAALKTLIDGVDTNVDSVVTTLGTPADTDLATDIANVQSDVDTIEGYLEPGGYII